MDGQATDERMSGKGTGKDKEEVLPPLTWPRAGVP